MAYLAGITAILKLLDGNNSDYVSYFVKMVSNRDSPVIRCMECSVPFSPPQENRYTRVTDSGGRFV